MIYLDVAYTEYEGLCVPDQGANSITNTELEINADRPCTMCYCRSYCNSNITCLGYSFGNLNDNNIGT